MSKLIPEIEIGDRIKFKCATRWANETVIRVVNGFFGEDKRPTVRYGGHGGFIVNHHEIKEVIKQ